METAILINGLIILLILIYAFVLSTIAGAMIIFLSNEIFKLIAARDDNLIPYWISWLFGIVATIIWIIFFFDFINSPF